MLIATEDAAGSSSRINVSLPSTPCEYRKSVSPNSPACAKASNPIRIGTLAPSATWVNVSPDTLAQSAKAACMVL